MSVLPGSSVNQRPLDNVHQDLDFANLQCLVLCVNTLSQGIFIGL